MGIISQVGESFDKIVKQSKEYAIEIIVNSLEIYDKRIYSVIDKKRFEIIKIVPRTILTSAGIITFKRRYYYDHTKEKYIYLLDNQLQIPKSIRMSNELIIKIMDLSSIMTYSEVGKHLSKAFELSKATIKKVVKETIVQKVEPKLVNIGTNTVHLQIDEKYVNINSEKKRDEKFDSKNKKRLYTATIFAGKEEVGTKGKCKLLNKSCLSTYSLSKLKKMINVALKTKYRRRVDSKIYLSGDLATYIQNFPEDITVCKAIYVPDKFHVIRDLRKIIGEKFNEDWLYKSDKLAEIVKILRKSDLKEAPKYLKLIKNHPGIFATYKNKKYLGCSQEGQNSHVYAPRFGKYANRFLPETIDKLALIREAMATGCDIEIAHSNREIPEKEDIGEISFDFSEKAKYYIDLSQMKYETQQMFKTIMYGR